MKAFFDFSRIPIRRVKTITVLLAALAAVATGCSKSNTSVTPSQNPAAATPATPSPTAQATPATSSQPATPAASDESTRTLQMLNRALMQWMIKNHRHPQTFEEFASSANFQIPDPPAGKKYALGARGFIVLVDNQ